MEKVVIYVLKLQSDKFYVGRTKNVEKRYNDHLLGKGSSYTKKYPPIKIEKIYYDMNPFDEDRYVKEYMYTYGIDNVRGGSYAMTELSRFDIRIIKREIWGALDKCFLCGRDHFSTYCNEVYTIDGEKIMRCNRCYRKGHVQEMCEEKYNIFNKEIGCRPQEGINVSKIQSLNISKKILPQEFSENDDLNTSDDTFISNVDVDVDLKSLDNSHKVSSKEPDEDLSGSSGEIISGAFDEVSSEEQTKKSKWKFCMIL